MTGPTVPVSGPEDGARDLIADLRASLDAAYPRRCLACPGDMADTTAGEADNAARLIAVRYRDPDIARFAINDYRDWVAARSGGAQDDGLRGRIEALAEEMDGRQAHAVVEASHHDVGTLWRTSWVGKGAAFGVAADRIRRALAGPDDARQDGAR